MQAPGRWGPVHQEPAQQRVKLAAWGGAALGWQRRQRRLLGRRLLLLRRCLGRRVQQWRQVGIHGCWSCGAAPGPLGSSGSIGCWPRRRLLLRRLQPLPVHQRRLLEVLNFLHLCLLALKLIQLLSERVLLLLLGHHLSNMPRFPLCWGVLLRLLLRRLWRELRRLRQELVLWGRLGGCWATRVGPAGRLRLHDSLRRLEVGWRNCARP